jgi:hypothetical protein
MLEAEHIGADVDEVDEHGWWCAIHAPREVTTAAGAVPLKRPRVNDKRIDG